MNMHSNHHENAPARSGNSGEGNEIHQGAGLTPERTWREAALELRQRMGYQPAPPVVACPWCGAEPGVACHVVTSTRNRRAAPRIRSTRDGCHPSRTEEAA